MADTGAHSTSTVTHPSPVTETRTSTLEVKLPPAQQANPLMSMDTWTPFLLFLGAVSGVLAVFGKHITSKIADHKEVHKPVHDAIDKSLSEMRLSLEQKGTRLDQMERSRQADVERIVKLETTVTNIEKGQVRIEASIEKSSTAHQNSMDKMMNAHQSNFIQLAQSIRELRDVRPKT